MAEPLKNHFGPAVPRKIAGMIAAVHRGFKTDAFLREVLDGYEALELTPRGWRIARTLRRYLPEAYADATGILLASLGPPLNNTGVMGMAPFLYLPHVLFVAEHGLDHFEVSMRAQYLLTQRFTAEFSIRRFLERYPQATLARLKTWATDSSVHVRRLVAEGTRPRLPWAPRLPRFQADPRPVLALLELLKDDPESYVRRSVANSLNDIGKDHPDLLVKTVRKWSEGASEERHWLIRHALRSAVKRGEPHALAVLGFGRAPEVSICKASISPQRAPIGESVVIAFALKNTGGRQQDVLVDFRVHFVKANGRTSPKVFKLKAVHLAPRESVRLQKSISLAQLTTRKHYRGTHKVDVVLNGRARPLGSFVLVMRQSRSAEVKR